MEKKKVLFILQEMTPYLEENETSLRGRILPQKIQEKGKEIRIFMPRYGIIKERRYQLHEVIRLSGMNIIVNDSDHSLVIKVATVPQSRMQVYFIDNDTYFHRKATFRDEEGKFFDDNDERIIFFARSVLETVKKLRWSPDLIYIQDWLGALIPIYLKKYYREDPLFSETKVVVGVRSDQFEENLNPKMKKKAKMETITEKDLALINTPSYANLMKLAIKHSDGVIYEAPEINEAIKKFVKQNKKPVLDYQNSEEFFNAYNEFYDQIINA